MMDYPKFENKYSKNEDKEISLQEKRVERSPLPPISREHPNPSFSQIENFKEPSVDWKGVNMVMAEKNLAMDENKLNMWLRSSKPATALTKMNHRFL